MNVCFLPLYTVDWTAGAWKVKSGSETYRKDQLWNVNNQIASKLAEASWLHACKFIA